MEGTSDNDQTLDINIARQVYDESVLSTAHRRSGYEVESDNKKTFRSVLRSKLASCSCSWGCVSRFLTGLFPIIHWLPNYSVKDDLLADVTGGVTVGIMHIPQGLAFAMLASLPPVTGLYTALVPVLLYMMMGTSRHLSVGSFAVISLMVAKVVEREAAIMSPDPTPTPGSPVNGSASTTSSPESGSGRWTPHDAIKMEVAVSLSFLIGIIQIVMGAVRLGGLAGFLSDPLISGFTTGSAVLVVVSQMKHIFGQTLPQITGALAAPRVVIHILKHIASSNVGAIITGVLCLLVLIGLKKVNERFKHKLPVPIPAELLVVIVGTAISYGAQINKNFDVPILKEIPKGLPPLSVPSFSLMSRIIPDAFVIAVVIFATNISISKMFAKKRGYSVDPNQELIAYGTGNIGGSFTSCFAICNALARTAVQENLANTQLCNVVVIALILLVLLLIAGLFYHLPKAILASVVIANLIGLLKQFSRLKELWTIYKTDAVVWFVSCFGVILMGVDVGLGIGVICELFAVVYTLSRTNYFILGQLKETELYRDMTECSSALEVPGVKVLRFESSLYFGNVERFRNALVMVSGRDPGTQQEPRKEVKFTRKDVSESDKLLKNRKGVGYNSNGKTPIGMPPSEQNENCKVEVDGEKREERVHTIVIDASSFTFIDSVGLSVLPSLMREFKKVGVEIRLAGCSSYMTKRLGKTAICTDAMFPSIHDAVTSAVRMLDLENNTTQM